MSVKFESSRFFRTALDVLSSKADVISSANIIGRLRIKALAISIRCSWPPDKHLQYFVDYLFSCQHWTRYEISLFGNTLNLLNYDTLKLLLNGIKTKIEAQQVTDKGFDDLISLLGNACLVLIRNLHTKDARELLQYTLNYISPVNYLSKTRAIFFDGLITIQEGNLDGINTAEQAIDVLKVIHPEMVKTYKNELDKTLTKFQ